MNAEFGVCAESWKTVKSQILGFADPATMLAAAMFSSVPAAVPNITAACNASKTALDHKMLPADVAYSNANVACFHWDFDPKNEAAESRDCSGHVADFDQACTQNGGTVYNDRHRLRMARSEQYHDRTSHVCLPPADTCGAEDITALGRITGMDWCKPFGMYLVDECDISYYLPALKTA